MSNTTGTAEVPTAKARHTTQPERRGSDVHERLLSLTSEILGIAGSLPRSRAGEHLADVLLRSATSAYFAHGAAEGSPSVKEFADKFRIALAELRTLRRGLQLLERCELPGWTALDKDALRSALEEADILVRIFFSSIRTLENKSS